MSFAEPNALERLEYMKSAKNVAIVGASDNPSRASYFVSTYLLSASHYKLFFVNPNLETILGQKVYKSLEDIPEPIDIVDVFRKASDIPGVLDEAIAIKAKTFWMQLGISDGVSAERGVAAGLNVVQDRCLKIEHARFAGGLNLAGFNTGVISSKRNKSI
ncbi:MAG: CoA-binding protein [Streptomycetaceae bacterium]|nr:MAG: CoA-binding protein [Streptomycetaceae bacterium]